MHYYKLDKHIDSFYKNEPIILPLSAMHTQMIHDLFVSGNDFFSLSEEEKKQWHLSNVLSGYKSLGSQYVGDVDHIDMAEMFYLRDEEKSLLPTETNPFVLQASLTKDFLTSIADELWKELCANYKGASYQIHDKSRLQYNAYQNIDTTERENYIEEHEDGVLFTIASSNSSGLLYKNANDEYIPIHNKGDKLVIMAGNLLHLLTGGEIPPLYHKVIKTEQNAKRHSVMLFVTLNYDQEGTPWISNNINEGKNIWQEAKIANSQFGLDF